MPAPIVFFDIAGPDLAGQKAFYSAVFGWDVGPVGHVSPPVIAGGVLPGFLRTDPAEKVLYIGVDDVKTAETDIAAHGGKVLVPRFEVKGVVVMYLFTDPAGNRMGLVEMKDGKPVIP